MGCRTQQFNELGRLGTKEERVNLKPYTRITVRTHVRQVILFPGPALGILRGRCSTLIQKENKRKYPAYFTFRLATRRDHTAFLGWNEYEHILCSK